MVAHARKRHITFLASPFDLASLHFLARDLRLPTIKIASGEFANAPLLLEAARLGRRLIVSTGMCSLSDIEEGLGVIAFGLGPRRARPSRSAFRAAYADARRQSLLRTRVTLLHCTSDYPAQLRDVNLLALDTLRAAFGLDVGYSDHTKGIAVSIAAVARGASVIEKHFTLNKSLPGPDHRASLTPEELFALVRGIREVELAMGGAAKVPTAAELRNRDVVRRSLVAARHIRQGQRLKEEDLTTKRPGTGIEPIMYWDVIGRRALLDSDPADLIVP